MEPRLIRSNQVDYEQAKWSGKNLSGYDPVGDRVLILPNKAKAQTSGGVFITDDLLERLNLSTTSGTIIALGEDAFAWNADRSRPWGVSYKPQPGDSIVFEKFAGLVLIGDDGEQYRLIDDKCIGAVQIKSN